MNSIHQAPNREDRPIEPCSSGEDPEQWSAIADWEAQRADVAEAERDDAIQRLKAEGKTCGYRTIRCPPDMHAGHIEFETVTHCGEQVCCGSECEQDWIFCPFCGGLVVR